MPKGVYYRSPEFIERLSKQIRNWYNKQSIKSRNELVEKQKQGRLRYYKTHTVNNKGKSHSKTTRKKISDSCKKAGVGKFNKYKKHTPEWIEKTTKKPKQAEDS